MLAAILADLSARYPQGYSCFTTGGKRRSEPELERCVSGWRVNVNGTFHIYSDDGVHVSEGYANRLKGGRF